MCERSNDRLLSKYNHIISLILCRILHIIKGAHLLVTARFSIKMISFVYVWSACVVWYYESIFIQLCNASSANIFEQLLASLNLLGFHSYFCNASLFSSYNMCAFLENLGTYANTFSSRSGSIGVSDSGLKYFVPQIVQQSSRKK